MTREELLVPILRDVSACIGPAELMQDDDCGSGEGAGERATPSSWPDGSTHWVRMPDSSRLGVWISDEEPLREQRQRVVETVHDEIVEWLWSAGRSTAWPPCPWHPDTHPLQVEEQAGKIVWACPRTSEQVAQVGELEC